MAAAACGHPSGSTQLARLAHCTSSQPTTLSSLITSTPPQSSSPFHSPPPPPTPQLPLHPTADFDDIPAIPDDEDDDSSSAFLAPSDSVLSLTYLPEHESLHIVSAAGLLLSLHVHSLLMTEVGRVSPAIAAASFSPDHELLAVVSTSYRLLLLTADGDVLSDQPLTETGEGVIPGQVMAVRSERDEAEARSGVNVTWRGDGQYVAVSTYHSAYHYRRLRVFSRLGESTSHSYPFPSQPHADGIGLSPLLHWRPSGNLITSTERRQIGHTIKHEVAHFERNGLRHGEFLLRQVEVAAGGTRQSEEEERGAGEAQASGGTSCTEGR